MVRMEVACMRLSPVKDVCNEVPTENDKAAAKSSRFFAGLFQAGPKQERNTPMRFDLHCHTTASDGVLSPADLVRRAAEKGGGVSGH